MVKEILPAASLPSVQVLFFSSVRERGRTIFCYIGCWWSNDLYKKCFPSDSPFDYLHGVHLLPLRLRPREKARPRLSYQL